MPIHSITRVCPLCRQDNSHAKALQISRDDWRLKECERCAFVYLENPPSVDQLENDFAWEKTSVAESSRRCERSPVSYQLRRQIKALRGRYFPRRKLRTLLAKYSRPGAILDIGCGWGNTLLNNLPENCVPFGLEISAELAAAARSRFVSLGGDVISGDASAALDALPESSFVAVTQIAILEHVLDPVELLAKSRRVVEPGGIMIVKVPNYGTLKRRVGGAEWCGLRFPDHVNYFTPQSLMECGRQAGLEVERFGRLDRRQTSDNMWCVFRKPRSHAIAA